MINMFEGADAFNDCSKKTLADGWATNSEFMNRYGTSWDTLPSAKPTCNDIDGSGTDFSSCEAGSNELKADLSGTCATCTCVPSDCCEATANGGGSATPTVAAGAAAATLLLVLFANI